MKRAVCIKYLGRELTVEFTYTPEEKEVWTYLNGDPGHERFPEDFDITKVWYGKRDITRLLTGDDYEEIEVLLTQNNEI